MSNTVNEDSYNSGTSVIKLHPESSYVTIVADLPEYDGQNLSYPVVIADRKGTEPLEQ